MSAPFAPITDAERTLRARGKLDQSCRACGFTSAATSRCNRCGGTDLEYRSHKGQADLPGALWCGGGKPTPGQGFRDGARGVSPRANAPEAPKAVSGGIPAEAGAA